MNRNDKCRLDIVGLDHQGRGIGKIDNKVVFVSDALPGEDVEVFITNSKSKFAEGRVINYIKKSNDRIEPLCPYFSRCGGCDLLHMSYENQLKYKEDKVKNIMIKYAHIDNVNSIVKCDMPLKYRNKVTFQVDRRIGMYTKKSNSVVSIDKCQLISDKMNHYLDVLNKMKLDLYSINEIVVRESYDDSMIIFMCKRNTNIDVSLLDTNVIKCVNDKYTVLKGNGYIIDKICNMKYKISPSSFFQVNKYEVETLYNLVKESLNLSKTDKVLDLYCGTGTIGLYIAKYCKEVLGIEINNDAIKDAKYNKNLNNIVNASFIAGDTAKVLSGVEFVPNKIVVDPPRSGLEKKVIDDLFNIKAETIIYVSCDPITLARDLNILKEKYAVENITPVDMFPNTYHVECVCVLKLR